MLPEEPNILLDVTRLVSRSWTQRRSTGIDRVCYAYLHHFRSNALAVVQHRGAIKVFDAVGSRDLFERLLAPSEGFRAKLMAIAPRLLMNTLANEAIAGRTYVNVSHTDFDLPQHTQWVQRHGLRAVYLIHDLIPITHPEFSRPHAVNRHLGRVRLALSGGAAIVVTSHAVADELADFAAREELPRPSPLVAPLGGEALLRLHAQRRAAPASPDSPSGHFLTVGTIEPRKNHRLLIEVWRDLVIRHGAAAPKLVIAGQKGPMTGDILEPILHDPRLAKRIEWRKSVSDAELAGLMASARAVLLPSLAEGFGLPLVEALAMSVPVIASDIPVFREIGQAVPQLVDPRNTQAWRRAIETHMAREVTPKPFAPPCWDDHFAALAPIVEAFRLKSAAKCEGSLAA